jgi:hypothetical protein
MVNNFNNLSGYQEMLRRTAPISQTAEDYAERIAKALSGNKRTITASKKDMAKIASKALPKTSGALGWVPYVGDVADIGLGLYNMTHGHPLIGAGQIGIGGVGLATGGLGGKVIKGVAKKPLEALLRKTMTHPYQTRTLPSLALQGATAINWGDDKNKKDNKVDKVPSDVPQYSLLSDDELGVNANNLPPIEEIAKIAQTYQVKPTEVIGQRPQYQLAPVPQVQMAPVPQYQPPVTDNTVDNYNQAYADELRDEYSKAYDIINRRRALDRMMYNLDRQGSRQLDRFDREYYANIAQARGNDSLAKIPDGIGSEQAMALDRYNARISNQEDAMKQLGAVNTLIGNMAVAKQLGMDPAVAMADKDIQKVLTAYGQAGSKENVANINAMAKMYGSDMGYNAKVFDSMLDNATAQAIAQGKYETAIQLQQLKNIGSTRNALINASGFGATPADIQAVLSRFGYAPVGLDKQGKLEGQQTGVSDDYFDELR